MLTEILSAEVDELVDQTGGIATTIKHQTDCIINTIGICLARFSGYRELISKDEDLSNDALALINAHYYDNR